MLHALTGGVWASLRQKMRSCGGVGLGLSLLLGGSAWANNDVEKNIANEKNWAMQAGDMANQRYSRLGQINKGTRVPVADVLWRGSQTMQDTGRVVRVLAAGHSSSPGALAVLDEASGVVFAGSWLEMQHLPDLRDARLHQWLAALAPWLKDDERLWVPAHGPVVQGRDGLQMRRYLQTLQACVQDHVNQGTSLIDMDKACAQPAFTAWAHYDSQHPRNVVRLYLQLEQEDLLGSQPQHP